MKHRLPFFCALALPWASAATFFGCGPALTPQVAAHSATLPLEGPCAPQSAGAEFADEVNELKLVVSHPETDSTEASGPVGALTVEELIPGSGYTVSLYGLTSGGNAAWRGVTHSVTVTAEATTPVDVLLTRIADLSCPRSGLADPRSFHTATLLDDGRVLIVGGANTSADASATCGQGCRRINATASVDIFDPNTGVFTPIFPGLTNARMMHTATLLEDGRVAIVGGTAEALIVPIDATNPFPIKPTLPIASVEVFDPSSDSFSSAGDDPAGARIFHAATTLADGTVFISGGIPDQAAVHNLSNALGSTTVCGGSPLFCRLGPNMNRRRAGHGMFTMGNGDVVVWGGSVDALGNDGYRLEILRAEGSGQFEIHDVGGMSPQRNVFFAAYAQYIPFRVLSAGGLLRSDAGTFSLAAPEGNNGGVYVYDASAVNGAGGISVGFPGQPVMALSTPRFFAAATSLPGTKRAIIGGGFTSLDFASSGALEFFDETDLSISALPVGGVDKTLREARGGLTATDLGNGAVLFVGGESAAGTMLQTGEIFTDIVDPAEAE